MRSTEHNETPVNRATSVFEWPAFNKISTSCRLSMPNILFPPPPGLHTGEVQVRVLPLIITAIAGWLRISGMRRVRISGTYNFYRDLMRRRRTTSHENGFGRQDLEAGSGALGLLRHAGAPAKSRIGYLIFMTGFDRRTRRTTQSCAGH